MELESSSTYPQVPATCPYSEPTPSSTHDPLQSTYVLTYLLHGAEPFVRSQPVNLAASQEIPRIYGTRKFLTVPTSARHLSLSWAKSIQSPRIPPTSALPTRLLIPTYVKRTIS
jgi:hypothetical protein